MCRFRPAFVFGIAVFAGFLLTRIAIGADATAAGRGDAAWPADIDPQSGSRLPPVNREQMDDHGKKLYDALVGRTGSRSIAGLRGPGGINLYSPRAAEHLSGLSNYLRYDSGMTGRVREIAILATAREMDNQFEWAAHETVALKEGVPGETVAAIKHRTSTDNLPEADAAIIQLARQAFGDKRVAADVFAKARKLFGDRGLVEIVMLMGNYSAIAVLLTTFDVQLPPGQPPLLPRR
jgi:4-carboxymuconolactone decarboxylase